MKRWMLIVAFWCTASSAQADLVQMPIGLCPPGTNLETSHRGPRCRPAVCDAQRPCPEEAACRPVAFCQRVLPYARGGSYVDRAGPCDADGACAPPSEGPPYTCERWSRCEPTVPTPAWDPESRTWTGEPHRVFEAATSDPDREGEPPPPEADREGEPPPPEAAGARPTSPVRAPQSSPDSSPPASGCSVGRGATDWPVSTLVLVAAMALGVRSRRRSG